MLPSSPTAPATTVPQAGSAAPHLHQACQPIDPPVPTPLGPPVLLSPSTTTLVPALPLPPLSLPAQTALYRSLVPAWLASVQTSGRYAPCSPTAGSSLS